MSLVSTNLQNTDQHYGMLSIRLHWIMFILIALVYACIELREFYPKGSDIREGLKTWHFMLGLLVLVLVSLRIVIRLSAGPAPSIIPTPPAWQTKLAAFVHFLLYVLMLALPIAGWLMLSAAGKPIPFFGLELPPLIDKQEALAKSIKELHQTVGTFGYYLIGLHTIAALFHHYIVKDNTLIRMRPKK
jgi:cytochrome b561